MRELHWAIENVGEIFAWINKPARANKSQIRLGAKSNGKFELDASSNDTETRFRFTQCASK